MSANTASTESIILSEDFFGVAFSPLIEALSGTKPERKDAFNSVRILAKMAGLLSGKEKILAVSYGTNISGSRIVVLTLAHAEAEIPPKVL